MSAPSGKKLVLLTIVAAVFVAAIVGFRSSVEDSSTATEASSDLKSESNSAPSRSGPQGASAGITVSSAGERAVAPAPESREAFRARTRETLARLPRKATLVAHSGASVHHFPAPLESAGKAMGEIAKRLKNDPALLPEALAFYRDCAQDAALPDSVRALCFSDHQRHGGESSATPIDPGQVPEKIRRLATKITF